MSFCSHRLLINSENQRFSEVKIQNYAFFKCRIFNADPHEKNIGTQGVHELFFCEQQVRVVVNNACQSMVSPVWSVKSDWSVKSSW